MTDFFNTDSKWIIRCPALVQTGFALFSPEQLSFFDMLLADENEYATEFAKNFFGQDHPEDMWTGESSKGFLHLADDFSDEVPGFLKELCFRWYINQCWISMAVTIKGDYLRAIFIDEKGNKEEDSLFKIIQIAEVWFQVEKCLAVWVCEDKNNIGFSPDYYCDPNILDLADQLPYLVPLTLERLQRLSQSVRRKYLESVGNVNRQYNIQYRLGLSDEQMDQLMYGETGFRLQLMLAAEGGDETAIKAWNAVK